MAVSMVNSSTFGSERNGNTKASCMQTNGLHSNSQSSSPLTATSATQSKNEYTETIDSSQLCKAQAVEPTPSQTERDEHKADNYEYVLSNSLNNLEANETKKTLFCSFPLDKVQTILSKYTSFRSDGNKMKVHRKVLCLYCDRTFVNVNLRQKHVERCHSSKQLRRVSLRKHQNFLTSTPCIYCDKFTSTEHTLKDLFKHLIENHSNRYSGCLSCEVRFLNSSYLADHNALHHNPVTTTQEDSSGCKDLTASMNTSLHSEKQDVQEEIPVKVTRRKQKARNESKMLVVNAAKIGSNVEESVKSCNMKNLRSKKLSVKSSRMILKRSKRLQAKLNDSSKKKRTRDFNEKKKSERQEQTFSTKLNEKSTKTASNFINPYPEFDHFFQVKKITDHSIDNLKISSLTFDDVFDKAFFNRIKCNIQENLLHHIDGKLFKNEESESRISNFEKNSNIPQETQNLNTENYGCELSLNAIAPTTLLLSNQLGDDPESQIEYGSKPSKKKTQMKKDEVHYKYFTRRKYQASILEHKENRDLSKLDMWTQYVIKNRQQKIIDDKKSPKEILDYFAGEEYKSVMRREELNRILDRRGPFEDLKEEASKKAALDKLNGENCSTDDDHFAEIGELLNEILNRVFELAKESCPSVPTSAKNVTHINENDFPEIPSYLNLRPSTDLVPENEIDKSDKIALICSSQETENFELPSNTVREKNEKVELTGEWARSRIYVCAACGLKLQNLKQFLEHKSASHQYIWVQHYEFVGNQSELYRHLSIPVLGKVGVLENVVQCKVWKRSDSRLCTKCGKQCNSLGELHRHILECGGDWTWMLARKKCKYRPFGAKSRRKRRGLVKRIYTQKTEPSEKKIYKKSFDLPRQKPSDADSIKRMLANLPPKRATRKIISLKDGFNTSRNKQVKSTRQSKFKCGKLIRGKTKEQNKIIKTEYEKTNKNQNNNYRRSLRCLNKVLTSRILDTNSSLIVRRKYTRTLKNEQEKRSNLHTDKSKNDANTEVRQKHSTKVSLKKIAKANDSVTTKVLNDKQIKGEFKSKRCSPRIEKRLEFSAAAEKMNIKRFFPVKKQINNIENIKHAHSKKLTTNDKHSKVNESPQKNKLKKTLMAHSEEVKNGQFTGIVNLRKRKIDNKNVDLSITKKTKVKSTSLTSKARKVKNNRSIINESNELKIHTGETVNNLENQEQTEAKDFFEEIITKNDLDPPDLEAVSTDVAELETVEETQPILDVEEPTESEKKLHMTGLDLEKNLFVTPTYENIPCITAQSFRSERTKRKLRKPARGLNDCIAMLTSKLNKNFEESTTNIVFNETTDKIQPENEEHDINKQPEYILKVPFSNEHFQLRSMSKESEPVEISNNSSQDTNLKIQDDECILDNLNGSLLNQESVSDSSCDEIEIYNQSLEADGSISKEHFVTTDGLNAVPKEKNEGLNEKREDNLTNQEYPSEATVYITEDKLPEEYKSTSNATEGPMRSTLLTDDVNQPKNVDNNRETDSEDEIPLSTLIKDEQYDRTMSFISSSNEIIDEFATNLQKTLPLPSITMQEINNEEMHSDEFHLICDDAFEKEYSKEVDDQKSASHITLHQGSEYTQIPNRSDMNSEEQSNEPAVDSYIKAKDVPVLTEITDNLCEEIESVNSTNITTVEDDTNRSEKSRKIIDNKLDDSPEIVAELTIESKDVNNTMNSANDNKEKYNFIPLEEHCESNLLSKLEKLSYPTKNGDGIPQIETDVFSDEQLNFAESNFDEENQLMADALEYKENSMLLLESSVGKSKQKKKSFNKNKAMEIQIKHNAKENDSQKNNGNKKAVRNAKTKALESILDDALLELSENELFLQNNLKNVLINDTLEADSQKSEPLKKCVKKHKSNPCTSTEKQVENEAITINNYEENNTELTNKTCPEELIEDCTTNLTQTSSQHSTFNEDVKSNIDNVKELRRSLRNSKRVTSYNETDIIDPLFDDLDSDRTISKIIKETTKDIFGIKRKSRKLLSNKKIPKNGHIERKLNGDELFDLLKTTPNENIVLSRPNNTFFNTFDEISNDFNDDNFDVFEDILEKSMAVIEKNLSEQTVPAMSEDLLNSQQVVNFESSNSNSNCQLRDRENKKKPSKKKSKKHKNKNIMLNKEVDNKLIPLQNTLSNEQGNIISPINTEHGSNVESLDNNDVNSNEVNQEDCLKVNEADKNKVIYCEICDKSFCRMESLTKHKRTLTHISKLSELEAKEAALKTKCDQFDTNEEAEITQISSDSRKDLNLLDMLGNMDEGECKQFASPFAVNINNSNLKLADIINDVLNKPILKKDSDAHAFPEIIMHNENESQPEIRRYKSLAERKSFESESCLITAKKNVDYFESELSNAAAGTILEKQITLLENIIENRSTLSYIDDLSVSSTQSVNENAGSESEVVASKTVNAVPIHSEQCMKEDNMKSNLEESFLKPSQYEEISEDSNLRNYDEQKSRKVLNRDEELFLECCSLLKSGSEVSSYSKKSNNLSKGLNNLRLKQCDEQDWLESNCLSQKENSGFVECYSDSSRIRTPLGDSFSQEDSNSATISSQWEMNNSCTLLKKEIWKDDPNLQNRNLTFEEVFNQKKNDRLFCKDSQVEELHPVISSFDRVISEVLETELNNKNFKKRSDLEEVSRVSDENKEFREAANVDGKKVLTKGAMKVFEGLKVSIPTEELNIDKILDAGPPTKTTRSSDSDLQNLTIKESEESSVKISKSAKRNSQNKSTVKTKTKHTSRPPNFKIENELQMNSKVHDVYDFEETQDNSDVFTRPDFRSFRNNHSEKTKKTEKPEGSDDDSQDCMDSMSFDAFSSSASSVSEMVPAKSRTPQNITKKKCMIMGRIFKNAVKSRIIDEDIRNIPAVDNTKLVEDFVLNCPEPATSATEKKTRMTEEEMNLAFDNLISCKPNESKQNIGKPCSYSPDKLQQKSSLTKRKQKTKSKKRNYGGSDSSDDEFKLQRSTKKRPKKKNNNTEDSCINLEQELRECIGVASRKSQRKCTSGKQNVLIEYWSSDESSFETILEKQIIDSVQNSGNDAKNNFVQDSQLKEVKTQSDNTTHYENLSQIVEPEPSHKKTKIAPMTGNISRRKRVAANPLYHWSSSSEDESRDLIEVRPVRDEIEDDEDRPVQHGWIVGDSPKKLVTMLAQAKGKKCDVDGVKEHGKKRSSTFS